MSFDIEKLYKENIENTVPDMDKLWDRIEARLDEQEKADSKTEHHDITPSDRPKKIKWSALITVAACAVIAVTGAFVVMNRNEVKTQKQSSTSETKKKSSEKTGMVKALDEENDAELNYESDNSGIFGIRENGDKAENKAEDIADEAAPDDTNNAAAEQEQIAEETPKNDVTPTEHTSTTAHSGGTSATTASDTTAASDTTQSAEDISKKIEARVNELLESDEYQDADASQKAELVTALFDEMMREGAVTSYNVDGTTGEAYCSGDGFTVTVTLGI
ncbi:MAG: anti-sigma factor [Ruminococcus sp.]|nr:anti-sigma factor [Ruminococcus sp.]